MQPLSPDVSGWTKLKTQVYNSRWTATQLAPLVEIPWVRFSNAQQGRVTLTPDEYERIAKALEIHPLDLVGFNDPDLEIVNISDASDSYKERNARLRVERRAINNLRLGNPDLYAHIIDTYGSEGFDVGSEGDYRNAEGPTGSKISNGSGG